MTAPNPSLEILYQDDQLVAINKPSGMLVHRGWAQDRFTALQCLRRQIGAYVHPIHRLDRGTSGVLIFALSQEMARSMQAKLEEESIHKVYLALCRGVRADLGRIDHPLAKEKGGVKQAAVTEFKLLESFGRYGLFQASPQTGRTHQIRRHLKHASHPIIGDTRYGKGEHNRLFREQYDFSRLGLHCLRYEFNHPHSGELLKIEAPLPIEFARVLERLASGVG